MLYTIGSRVKLRQTGDVGTISNILGDGLVEVRLDGGLGYIPVPTSSLTYEHDMPPDGDKSDGARFVPGKQSGNTEIEPTDLGLEYTILKPWGIQLAFDPVMNAARDTPDRYRIYLINDTQSPVIFQLVLELAGKENWSRVGKLSGSSYVEAGELKHHELNDQPTVMLEIRKQLDTGTGPKLHRKLKLKPKQFFKQQLTAPLLNRRVYHYTVFKALEPEKKAAKTGESLSQITKREAGRKPTINNLRYRDNTPNPGDIAAFPREIDLHIEALVSSPGSIPRGKYLSTQLEHCRAYLRRANELGIDRVFLIHGVGEGKLKAAVHSELKKTHFVTSFKNEYHELYGNGATEVRM